MQDFECIRRATSTYNPQSKHQASAAMKLSIQWTQIAVLPNVSQENDSTITVKSTNCSGMIEIIEPPSLKPENNPGRACMFQWTSQARTIRSWMSIRGLIFRCVRLEMYQLARWYNLKYRSIPRHLGKRNHHLSVSYLGKLEKGARCRNIKELFHLNANIVHCFLCASSARKSSPILVITRG